VVAWISVGAVLCLAFLPRERNLRWSSAAPQQHAENILVGVQNQAKPTLLLVEDPFEVDAISLQLFRNGNTNSPIVVSASNLDDRWYLSELIRLEPEVLISSATGGRDKIFGDIVRLNLGRWDVEWAVSEIPPIPNSSPEHCGYKAVPRVLTQHLVDSRDNILEEDPSPHYDLSDLMEESLRKAGPARDAISRYAVGLQSWAVSQSRAGLYPSALRGFERALSMDPSYDAPRQALDRLYSEKAMVGAARLQFEQTAKNLPPRIQAIDRKLAKAKPEDQAAGLAEKAKITEELVDALNHLGIIYDHAGRYDESRKVLEQVLQYKPARAETQLALAKLFLKVGNRSQAQAAFKSVLQADPENKEAQAELWKLINKP
jgi:tetratricopeptide (TPR) repeat protein